MHLKLASRLPHGKTLTAAALLILPLVLLARRRSQSVPAIHRLSNPSLSPDRRAVHLTSSAETLLIPLYYRALDSTQPISCLKDSKAADIVSQLDYDFTKIKAKSLSLKGVLLRAQAIDRIVKAYLASHPRAIVVELGCGLDTRYSRLNTGAFTWFDLDFPEVIALRRQFIPETPQHQFLSHSVLDFTWMDALPTGQPVLFIAEAVFPFLTEEAVKILLLKLQERFPGCEIAFDGVPPLLARMGGRWHPSLWHTHARIGWGLGNPASVAAWAPDIQCLGTEQYYVEGQSARAPILFPGFFNAFKVVHYRLG